MPAYNSAGTVGETLESVRAQSFADWEVVVCDDLSTDDTIDRVEQLRDGRIRVVPSPVNGGPAAARNRALGHAESELIAFLDADDLWRPDYLERQVRRYDEECRRGRRVGIVACNALLAKDDGSLEPHTYFELFGRRKLEPVTVERLLRRNTIFISCLVPRAAGEQAGWFDPDLFGTEDHDLWLKIVELGYDVVIDHEPLATYRRGATSISRNTPRQAQNNQKTLLAALRRGRLTPRQQRVARSELRYNRALAAVAAAAFDHKPPPARALPDVLWVAVTRPAQWGQWLTALRSQ